MLYFWDLNTPGIKAPFFFYLAMNDNIWFVFHIIDVHFFPFSSSAISNVTYEDYFFSQSVVSDMKIQIPIFLFVCV